MQVWLADRSAKMHAVVGQPLSCLLCKYKALTSIETSLEKQGRKNRLSWGNSPFSKHRKFVTGHARVATFDSEQPSDRPGSLPWTRQENGTREGGWLKPAVPLSLQVLSESESEQRDVFLLENFGHTGSVGVISVGAAVLLLNAEKVTFCFQKAR